MPRSPNKIRQRANSPMACQKVISRHPNTAGRFQFHNCITTSPPITMKAATPSDAARAIPILFMCSSPLHKLVVYVLQPLAQMQHRIPLAREQRVNAYAAFCRQLFKTAPVDLMRDEYFALLVGQFVERKFQFLKK